MLECLRSKDVDDLFSASWFTSQMFDFPFAPVYGTDFLPEDPKEVVVKQILNSKSFNFLISFKFVLFF